MWPATGPAPATGGAAAGYRVREARGAGGYFVISQFGDAWKGGHDDRQTAPRDSLLVLRQLRSLLRRRDLRACRQEATRPG